MFKSIVSFDFESACVHVNVLVQIVCVLIVYRLFSFVLVCLFFCFGFTFQCFFLLVAHKECCFGFVPRLVFILRCKTTISVFVCLLRIIAAPVYV